ncbi:hypothetical protein OC842_002085 [Tilletia horrida]|uniref:Uncharacterized protein n=1 Tax=Tilletia horrida TaxID=155126 RepID=A0AAN6GDT8_9BASI|nr:hypothetical protein OC842_002085 [Tilletia horrida]
MSAGGSSADKALNAAQTLLADVLALPSTPPSRGNKRRKTSHPPTSHPFSDAELAASASSALSTHLQRVQDGTTLVLTNPARPRPVPAPTSKEGRKLKKRDRRVVDRMRRDERRGNETLSEEKGKRKGRDGHGNAKEVEEEVGKQVALSRMAKKRLGFFDRHPNLNYAAVKPLSSLWESYVQLLLGLRHEAGHVQPSAVQHLFQEDAEDGSWTVREGAMTSLQTTLSKVDLTGASVRVIRCSDPARVGLQGLVARETENTLLIAVAPPPLHESSVQAQRNLQPTEAQAGDALRQRRSARPLSQNVARRDEVRVVPKHNTVFELQVPLPPLPSSSATATATAQTLAVPLYGNQMSQGLPTRATKKHKARKSVDF